MSEDRLSFKPASMPVRDNGSAEVLYFDGFHGLSLMGGNVFLNATRTTVTAPGSEELPHAYIDTVSRFVIPAGSFATIVDFLQEHLQKMIDDGLIAPPEPREPQAAPEKSVNAEEN